jgi:hypothetical protein
MDEQAIVDLTADDHDLQLDDPRQAVAAPHWRRREDIPLGAAPFYAAELARGVPDLGPGEGNPAGEGEVWAEVVAWGSIEQAEHAAEIAVDQGPVQDVGDPPFREWGVEKLPIRGELLDGLWSELEQTLNERRALFSAVVLVLLRASGADDMDEFLGSGSMTAYPPPVFGLPFFAAVWPSHAIPFELDSALVLRRWLREHPPTVTVASLAE